MRHSHRFILLEGCYFLLICSLFVNSLAYLDQEKSSFGLPPIAITIFLGLVILFRLYQLPSTRAEYLLLSARDSLHRKDFRAAQAQVARISPTHLAKVDTPLDLWVLGKIAYEGQDLSRAADYLQRVLSAGSPSVDVAAEARLLLAQIAHKQGNPVDTETYLQIAQFLQPSNEIMKEIQAFRAAVKTQFDGH